jgi:hypothetical protein
MLTSDYGAAAGHLASKHDMLITDNSALSACCNGARLVNGGPQQAHELIRAPVVGGAEKLRNVLAMSDASTKLLRFTSDDVWGSKGVCRVISRSISAYLVQAWDVRNSCKHNGAVLPLSAAPVGRGADGVDAMA